MSPRFSAQELKYHLDVLTGRDVRLVADAGSVPAIVFESGKGPVGESRLKLDGRHLARGLDVAEADIALSFDHTKADEAKFVRLLKERCKADPLVWNPNWYGSAFYGIHLGKGK